MHEVLVNRLGGLSLPRKSVVRLTDRPDMTLDVYHGRKTTMQQQQKFTTKFLKWARHCQASYPVYRQVLFQQKYYHIQFSDNINLKNFKMNL